MASTTIKPNDVVVILRPDVQEDGEWEGNFEIVIGGFGPVTMSEDATRELVSMAMLIATIVPMMEKDEKLTERVMTECAKLYGDADDIIDSTVSKTTDIVLTADTETVGGMQ